MIEPFLSINLSHSVRGAVARGARFVGGKERPNSQLVKSLKF